MGSRIQGIPCGAQELLPPRRGDTHPIRGGTILAALCGGQLGKTTTVWTRKCRHVSFPHALNICPTSFLLPSSSLSSFFSSPSCFSMPQPPTPPLPPTLVHSTTP